MKNHCCLEMPTSVNVFDMYAINKEAYIGIVHFQSRRPLSASPAGNLMKIRLVLRGVYIRGSNGSF